MTWNYRLTKEIHSGDEDVSYQIKEVYYNPDGSIWGMTENSVSVYGETAEEARACLDNMQLAFDQAVLDLDGFVFAKAYFDEEKKD
jgi:hypothetical protein